MPGVIFLLRFLVCLVLTAVFTELTDLKAILELLLVLVAVVVDTTTDGTLELYEIILRHIYGSP